MFFLQLSDIEYYALLSKLSACLCAITIGVLVFFVRKSSKKNKVLTGKSDLNVLQSCLTIFLLFFAIVTYAYYGRYAAKSEWLEVEPRYHEYVKSTKPEYACATYIGTYKYDYSGGRGGSGAAGFLLDDGSYIVGYGDADPSLANSLEKNERICIKYLVMPSFLNKGFGFDKKVIEISRHTDDAGCDVRQCWGD